MTNGIFVFTFLLFISLPGYAQLNSAFTVSGSIQYGNNLGAMATPVQVCWRQVQKYLNSSYNWSSVDTLVKAAQLSGWEPWIVIECTNPITANDSIPGTCAYMFDHGTTDNLSSWFPEDTMKWKLFLDALIERYDGDGTSDMPGLARPVTKWHIGQEWPRIWCSTFNKDSLQFAVEFTRYEVMTYNEIKKHQPQSTISFAGLTDHRINAFYDGYYNQATYCLSNDCATQSNVTHEMLASVPQFLAERRNTLYLLQNAKYDELDVHQYGQWKHIPDVVRWCKDHFGSQSIPVVFFEGGGPFCKSCENTYHTTSDTVGTLPLELVRDNASYVIYYFLTGLASNVKRLNWNVSPEYNNWGYIWGDLDLLNINHIPKPSFYTYRFLARDIFTNENADTVVRINESNPNLYHYRIEPLGMEVIWSTNSMDSLIVNGNGKLTLYHIPVVMNDSVVSIDTVSISRFYQISLTGGVPIFFKLTNPTGIDGKEPLQVPLMFELSQNYPNPFNPTTTIRFYLPQELLTTLKVYDPLGQEVATLVSGELSAGTHSVKFNPSNLASGVYFCRLHAGSFTETKKLILLK